MNTDSWAAFVGVACIFLMVLDAGSAVSISMVNGQVLISGANADKYTIVTDGNRSLVKDPRGRIVSSFMSSGNSQNGYRRSTHTSFGNGGGYVSTSSSSSSGRRASNMARAIHSRTQRMINSMFDDMGMGGMLRMGGGGGAMSMAMAGV